MPHSAGVRICSLCSHAMFHMGEHRETGPTRSARAASRSGRVPLTVAGVLAAWILAGCSSGPSTTAPSSAPSTAPSATAAPATTVPGAAAPGTKLAVPVPAGGSVEISATRAQQDGVMFGGPSGSWDTGIEVYNTGGVPYAFDPATQVVVVDSAGRRRTPLATATAQAVSVQGGQSSGRIVVFVLPAHVTPVTTELIPMPGSGAPLVWSAA